MEGKWFATTEADADTWGAKLNQGRGVTVETRIPASVAEQLHFDSSKLDGVGNGYYVNEDQMNILNDSMDGIRLP